MTLSELPTTNYGHAFPERPEVYAAWQQLNGVIPDASFNELEPEVRAVLVVGPIAAA